MLQYVHMHKFFCYEILGYTSLALYQSTQFNGNWDYRIFPELWIQNTMKNKVQTKLLIIPLLTYRLIIARVYMRKLTEIQNGNGLLNTLPPGKFKSCGIRNELIVRKQREAEWMHNFRTQELTRKDSVSL